MSHLPINQDEMQQRGWDELDVIFVSGDAYIDHPAFGVPLLARWLEAHGFRVGIIPQPDWRDLQAFRVLGRPRLFFAVAAGAMDSMVAHYTPQKKLRHDDAYTPGGKHGARPNRATMVYTSCCRAAYKEAPVVVGGIEASLRRFAHYDYWEDKVRRSILFDSKADLLIYGMGEKPLLELAKRLRDGERFAAIRDIRGTAFIGKREVDNPPRRYGDTEKNQNGEIGKINPQGFCCASSSNVALREISVPSVSPWLTNDFVLLPSYEEAAGNKQCYSEAFRLMANEQNPWCGKPLAQQHGDRWLVANPPPLPLTTAELDEVYALPFTRLPHPSYTELIPAWEQIKASITTHRGCSGGCAFCAITHHQGKTIQSRSEESVLDELRQLTALPWFKGSVSDLGGPTANMYGQRCGDRAAEQACRRASCLYPSICRNLKLADERAARLLAQARQIKGIRHTAVASGVRYDLLVRQPAYFRELLAHQVGGLLKVAPEHLCERVTKVMRKPGPNAFAAFLEQFRAENSRLGKRQAVVPYFIAGHPGCSLSDMVDLALELRRLGLKVEQVQEFTPTPGSLATCIYYTGVDPFTGTTVYVPLSDKEKRLQKALLLAHLPEEHDRVREALRQSGRQADGSTLLSEILRTSRVGNRR